MLNRIYPHDETRVNDNSEFAVPVVDGEVSGYYYLQALLADKGRDNVLLTFEGPSAYSKFTKEFGTGNFKRHGQAMLQAERILKLGGNLHAIRVMPDNATFANVIVAAKIKEVKAVPKTNSTGEPLYLTPGGEEVTVALENTPIVRDMVEIKITTSTVSNLSTFESIETALIGTYDDTADSNGYKTFPLFIIASRGRGSFGNKLHFRITRNPVAEKDRDYKVYNLESYENNGGLVRLETPYAASLYSEAIHNGLTEYLEQVVSEYSNNFQLLISETHIGMLLTEIKKTVPTMTEEKLDILFGYGEENTSHYNLKMAESSTDLTAIQGIKLEMGSDGDFDMAVPTRDDVIESMLVRAYSGDLDQGVFDVWSYPVNIMLDANYPAAVKNEINGLKSTRTDCVAIIDAGIQPNGTSLIKWRKDEFPNNEYDTFLYGESGKIKDPTTLKNIYVTETYHLSLDLVKHINSKGSHIPFAGMEIAGYASQYVKGTQTPVINDPNLQDVLYENRVNITEFFRGNRIRETEVSSQYKTSDLSFIHNVLTLKELKRDLELKAKRKRYNFAEESDIDTFAAEGNEFLDINYSNKNIKSAKLRLEQSAQEKAAGIVRWVVDVQFKDIIIYNVLELNIN